MDGMSQVLSFLFFLGGNCFGQTIRKSRYDFWVTLSSLDMHLLVHLRKKADAQNYVN